MSLPEPFYQEAGITLYRGDCREILPELPPVDLAHFDPPYGVGRKYDSNYDDRRDGYWDWFIPTLALIRSKSKVVSMHHLLFSLKYLTDWDWVISWYKPYGAGARVGNSPILPHWEPILLWGIHTLGTKRQVLQDFIICNPEPSHRPQIGKSPRNADDLKGNGHPLPKPLVLEIKLVSRLSDKGSTVLDPFMGSGTTLVAAKMLGRKAIGIEISERYCEIAAKRLAQEVMPLKIESETITQEALL